MLRILFDKQTNKCIIRLFVCLSFSIVFRLLPVLRTQVLQPDSLGANASHTHAKKTNKKKT